MPTLTRWFVKTALLSLVAALALGALLAAQAAFDLPERIGLLAPLYFHLFLVGFVAQLIFGVAYWMFPKASKERPRGSEALGWA
ncbi:MAG: hypothetical protein K8I02_12260, partial [Candidatus Methylomirabilis sp.]|nr:hypothetical protein [Deltaproteobacteria bacterium]